MVQASEKEEIDFERLKRIHDIKVKFCEKKNTSRSPSHQEPDLIKKFVPVESSDIKALKDAILDGSYDLDAED